MHIAINANHQEVICPLAFGRIVELVEGDTASGCVGHWVVVFYPLAAIKFSAFLNKLFKSGLDLEGVFSFFSK